MKRALAVTVVLAVAGLAVDVVLGYSPIPGYGLLLGLGGCVLIVIGSKWVGKALLQRDETYYDHTEEASRG